MTRSLLAPRLAMLLCAITAGAAAMLAPVNGVASASHAVTVAEDAEYVVIHMRDGRELAGRVVSENSTQIVIRYVDPAVRIETTLTLMKRDIVDIERNVEAEDEGLDDERPSADDGGDPYSPERLAEMPEATHEKGLSEGDASDERLPSFYVIPMKGQMGTDIHPDVYTRVASELRAAKPDVVVWVLHCSDRDDLLIPLNDERDSGLILIDEYRELVRMLHDELRGIRQVMWVHDAWGISSIMALAWPEMYMRPEARLFGMVEFYLRTAGIQDPEVLAKNREYWLGAGNAFLERGGRSIKLGMAMMDPRQVLSASWHGRDVVWHLDLSGEYVVNNNRRAPAYFYAKTAEDFAISSGTAETLDDLALLMGYREYRVITGPANQFVERYLVDWRRAFENTKRLWGDYQQYLRWADGGDELRYLGRARGAIRDIIATIERFPAVALRWGNDYGMTKFRLVTIEEQLNERIRALRTRGGRGGGGGRPGGAGGGGIGGPR